MESNSLETAKNLLDNGKILEARNILQGIINSNKQDMAAWTLYVKSYSSIKERIRILEYCLKFDSDNQNVIQFIDKLRSLETQAVTHSEIKIPHQDSEIRSTSNETTAIKACPFCAEIIKKEAIVCRFCGREVKPKPKRKRPNRMDLS